MSFKEICEQRYATKLFDGSTLPQDKVDELLELIRLTPTSFGLQSFKVVVVANKELKEKLQPASFNQPQIGTASHVLVFCADTRVNKRVDDYEQLAIENGMPEDKAKTYTDFMRNFIKNVPVERHSPWSQKQVYIALAHALLGAKSLGFDSCPMEGFDADQYTKILELPEYLVPTVICPIGIAADEPKPKLRFSKEDLFINK